MNLRFTTQTQRSADPHAAAKNRALSGTAPCDAAALLRRSFTAVLAMPTGFARVFYARLFELAPTTRALFPNDIEPQQQRLMQAIAVLIRCLDTPDHIEPLLRQLGARHAGYGVEPWHYSLVGEALLDSLERSGASPLSTETRAAWTQLYGWAAALMIEGATGTDRLRNIPAKTPGADRPG